ncbi:MAG TPA: hypothetical protein VG123_27530 [Streptosporangiaceae bacterium]|nr:hypothetical protein [Streptosporangiaceae bacterium]
MTTPTGRRGRLMLAAVAAAAAIAIAIAVVAFARPGRPAEPAFPQLHPAAAPASWRHLALPNGTAVLYYPPGLRAIAGDKDAVSAARLSPGGAFQLYLNATPRQGSERLAHWAAFRLHLLRSDDASSARQVAAAQRIKFRGGTGSCVMDRYVTRIGGHHFQEIACLVQGHHTTASVIVAAAPAAQWATARPLLLRAVAAYRTR